MVRVYHTSPPPRREGSPLNVPPMFDGTSYITWKWKMQIFVESTNFAIWKIMRDGPCPITRVEDERVVVIPEEEWSVDDCKKHELNTKAMFYMCCAMDDFALSQLTMCKSAKEMWTRLEHLYNEEPSDFDDDNNEQPFEERKPPYAD